jgi:coenzyme F420-reducing hydrogenase delta subunit/NAD-dependent dihydropyrimidine dehydrogenase PreA subunit
MACPYDAPRLYEKRENGEVSRLSKVDSNKCMGCGTCVAACPMGAISRPGVSNQDLREKLRFESIKNGSPHLVTFVCDWCLRANADLEILENLPENVQVIHIPCSGRIDPELALMALRSGIDGVLVCGCKPGECHFQRGPITSSFKVSLLDRVYDQIEENEGRIKFIPIGTTDRGRIRSDLPIALLSGGADSATENGRAVRWLHKQYRQRYGMKDVTLKIWEGARHELFNEINRDEVIAFILQWLTQRTGRSREAHDQGRGK